MITVPPYVLTEENTAQYKKEQNEWYIDGNAIGRFSGVYGNLYKVSGLSLRSRCGGWLLNAMLLGPCSGSGATRLQCVGSRQHQVQ